MQDKKNITKIIGTKKILTVSFNKNNMDSYSYPCLKLDIGGWL